MHQEDITRLKDITHQQHTRDIETRQAAVARQLKLAIAKLTLDANQDNLQKLLHMLSVAEK
jgi:hypothetical protein